MHKALHPRDDVEILYVARKEGGRRLASIKDSVDELIQRLDGYIEKKTKEDWLQPSETIRATRWTIKCQ